MQALDVVRALLSDPKVEKEKILDTPDKQNRTPLHLASFKQNENLTKILLEARALLHQPLCSPPTSTEPISLRSLARTAT